MARKPKQQVPLQKDIHWRAALGERPFLGGFVLLARGTMLVAIVVTFLVATALLFYSLYLIADTGYMIWTGKAETKQITLVAIEAVDAFLLITVLHVIGIGLYQLYIQNEIPVPHWVQIATIEDLKVKLSGVLVLVLAVYFLGRVITRGDAQELFYMGTGIALVIAALTLFVWVQHTRPEE